MSEAKPSYDTEGQPSPYSDDEGHGVCATCDGAGWISTDCPKCRTNVGSEPCPECHVQEDPDETLESRIENHVHRYEDALAVADGLIAQVAEQRAVMRAIEADSELRLRRQHAAVGEKVTEGSIAAEVLCDEVVSDARARLLEAEAELQRAKSRLDLLEVERWALTRLTELATRAQRED